MIEWLNACPPLVGMNEERNAKLGEGMNA